METWLGRAPAFALSWASETLPDPVHTLIALVAIVITWKCAGIQKRSALREVKARDALMRATESSVTIRESFTVEWLNVILGHTWNVLLEQMIAKEAFEATQDVLNREIQQLLANGSSVIEEAEVEEFTLGMVPPKFHSCFASYSPDRKYLQFELDTDFASSGFSMVIKTKLRMHAKLPVLVGRLKMDDIKVSGKVLIGLPLVDRPPGITGYYISFKERPSIEAKFSPLGIAISKVPGVASWLDDLVVDRVTKLMVEPGRNWTSLERKFLQARLDAASGPGGMLTVTVMEGSDLPAADPQSGTSDPYCEIQFGGQTRRTKIIRGTLAPRWDATFEFPLPAWAAAASVLTAAQEAELVVRITCYDYDSVGEPDFLGECDVLLGAFAGGGAPVAMMARAEQWLPLCRARRGRLKVAVAAQPPLPDGWEESEAAGPKPPAPAEVGKEEGIHGGGEGEKNAGGKAGPPSSSPMAGALAARVGAEEAMYQIERRKRRIVEQRYEKALADLEAAGRRGSAGEDSPAEHSSKSIHDSAVKKAAADSEVLGLRKELKSLKGFLSSEQERVQHLEGELAAREAELRGLRGLQARHGAPGQARSLGGSPGGKAGDTGAGGGLSSYGAATLEVMLQVARLEKLLNKERVDREAERAEHLTKIEELELELDAFKLQRRSEETRALIEGAPFLLTTKAGAPPALRHVWYSPASNSIKWSSPGGHAGKAKEHNQVSVRDVLRVESGAKAWPQPEEMSTPSKMFRKAPAPPPPDNQCFSLVLSGATSLTGVGSLNMQMPVHGNGRARDEWLNAFKDLQAGELLVR